MPDIALDFEVPEGIPPHPSEPFRETQGPENKGEGIQATPFQGGEQVERPE